MDSWVEMRQGRRGAGKLDGPARAVPHSAMVFWAAVGGLVLVLLVASWLMDRAVRRRGSGVLHSGDISYEVREGRRDAEILGNPANHDISWSSWSRRNARR